MQQFPVLPDDSECFRREHGIEFIQPSGKCKPEAGPHLIYATTLQSINQKTIIEDYSYMVKHFHTASTTGREGQEEYLPFENVPCA